MGLLISRDKFTGPFGMPCVSRDFTFQSIQRRDRINFKVMMVMSVDCLKIHGIAHVPGQVQRICLARHAYPRILPIPSLLIPWDLPGQTGPKVIGLGLGLGYRFRFRVRFKL